MWQKPLEKGMQMWLRDIENLECSPEFRERNFALCKYSVENNRKTYPMMYMTRDGFTILVMGYTGEKLCSSKKHTSDSSMQWKKH